MKVKSLAPWFGGKRNLAPEIIAEFGKHSAYWEPFCGSCAVLFSKEPASHETINDQHGNLINLARAVRDEHLGPELFARANRVLCCERLQLEAAERLARFPENAPAPPAVDLERALDYLSVSWIGRNGMSGTKRYKAGFAKRYTKNGGSPSVRWSAAVESIPDWHYRLQRVTILNEDGFCLLNKIEDAEGVVVYVDPPYYEKSGEYVHDFDPVDHEILYVLLSRFQKTRVIVSYYDHPVINEIYSSWTRRNLRASKSLAKAGKQGAKGAVSAPEVLFINGPSLVEPKAVA